MYYNKKDLIPETESSQQAISDVQVLEKQTTFGQNCLIKV